MQVTKIGLFAIRVLLRECMAGTHVAGYSVRPGFSDGLILSSRKPPMSGLVGVIK